MEENKNVTNNKSIQTSNVSKSNVNSPLIIIIVILLILLGIGGYFLFFNNKKEELPYPNDDSRFRYSTYDGQKYTKYERINLTEENTEVLVNDKKVKIKIVDNHIYVNDVDTNIISDTKHNLLNDDYKVPYVDITDYFIMTYRDAGEYDVNEAIIDENGKSLNLLNGGTLGNTYFYLEDNILYAVEMIFDEEDEYKPYYLFQAKYDDGKIYFQSVAQPVEQKFYMLRNVSLDENNIQIRLMASVKPFNIRVSDGKVYVNDIVVLDDENVHPYEAYVTRDLIFLISDDQCGLVMKYAIDKNGKIINFQENDPYGIEVEYESLVYAHNKLIAKHLSMDINEEVECIDKGDIEFVYNNKTIEIKNIKK